ncbi:MAG: type III-A CRISPR-associated RAMP protein Csm4 [Promethearchaeota archaeon]
MIEKFECIKLYFKTPVHFGIYSTDLSKSQLYLPSDSLFGAIISAWSKLLPDEVDNIINNYIENSPFLISSAYPFIENIFFFPKPFSRGNFTENFIKRPSNIKKIKNIRWLPKEIFEYWINFQPLDFYKEEIFDSIKLLHSNIKEIIIPKTSLDRIHNCSMLYFISEIFFSKSAGLFFLINKNQNISNNKIINYFYAALNLLEDEGLGGKRSWGLGAFKYERTTIEINIPNNSEGFITLSPFLPKNKLIFNKAKWDFTIRKGWGLSYSYNWSFLKPRLILLREGSIFEKKPIGTCKIFTFNKLDQNIVKYFFYGKAFPLPIKEIN